MEFITVFRVLCFARALAGWMCHAIDFAPRRPLLFGPNRCALLLANGQAGERAGGFSRPIAPARLLGRCVAAAAAGMSTASFSFRCVTALYFNTAIRFTISPASKSA